MTPTVVVTGASSGIGACLARAWGKRNARVVLCARDERALERVAAEIVRAGGQAVCVPGDVTREDDRLRLMDRARSETGRIDVLVNNAGRGYYGGLVGVDVAELEALFALNVVAPLRLLQLALDPLTRAGGTLVMVSSVAGVAALPRMGAYAASKFALEAIATVLRAELVGTGVHVLVVRPGPVDTPFRSRSLCTDGSAGVRPRGVAVQTPDEVAEQTVRAVLSRQSVVETTPFVRAASLVARVAPAMMGWIATAMVASNAGDK
ncbi:MAG: SDR family NAD(P)-dependent oxidoreductase [Polyangiaceae bacterium]|jgi:short-subunit dehydrogenase